MEKTKVSTKYQVVIPKKARKKAGIKHGQILDVEVREDGVVVLSPQSNMKWPDDYIGTEKDIWGKIDIKKYLAEEDASWDF